MSSVLQYANNAFIERQRAESEALKRDAQRLMRVETDLASHIRRAWERNRDHKRRDLEPRMLACLRQRNGEYDPDVLAEIRKTGGSEIFMMLTATKCRAAMAWIRDILLPAGDRAWSLEATPVPEVPPQFMAKIQAQVVVEVHQELAELQAQQAQAQGAPMPPQAEPTPGGPPGGGAMPAVAELRAEVAARVEERAHEIKEAAQERAKKAAEKMADRVADQLAEGHYDDALEEFIDDFVTFPFAVLKGPVKRRRPTLKWAEGWRPVQAFEVRDEVERISPFDIYPSPDARTFNDGELCEHVRFSRSDLYESIGLDGWNEEQIRSALKDYGEGGLRLWLWSEAERASLEGRDLWSIDEERIDAVHYWGRAQGRKLIEWGMSARAIEDPLADYEIEAILIGRYVVRAVLNRDPLYRRPYMKASFQRVPGSLAGKALPELMSDIQRMCNATGRALANNMALSSGPIVEVFADRIADGEDVTDIHPWRIFQTKSDPMGGSNNRAIQFYQPSSNSAALLQVFEWFERKADDATNIPRYVYGNERMTGAGQTASGLSMLMESASKGIRAAISHIDQGVIRPLIRRFYYENMLYSDDKSIKGDLKVIARGAAALVAKDSAQARRMEALSLISNELGMQVVGIEGYAEMLREIFQGADLPEGIIPTREQLAQRLKEQSQQPGPDQIEAEQEAMKLKLEAAEKDRRFGLDVEKHRLEVEDVRHDNRLDAAKLRQEERYKQQERNAVTQRQPGAGR